jgi:Phospholipase_D-nuclease N-terminal
LGKEDVALVALGHIGLPAQPAHRPSIALDIGGWHVNSFWDLFWWFFWVYVFIAYLMVLFSIIADIFRDHSMNGWLKAVWIIFLVFFPFLGALVYLIARGRGMAERSGREVQQARTAQDEYIRNVAGASSSSSDEIAKAKALHDAGTISQSEFDLLKSKALGT